ncbi:MAG: hypothetical protein JWN15_2437 [Firmicutes bacterium]|nr:hypothetical protein [Bacillota bacterium]
MNAMTRLSHAQVRELERRVADLPVAEADLIIDRAFYASGIAWLRRNGWLPVDTAECEQELAS